MQFTPEQQKKLKRLALVLDEKNTAVSKHIFEVEDRVEELANQIPPIDEVIARVKDGEKGDRGERGEAGIQGEVGKAGRDGKDGKDGKDGAQGKTGRDGIGIKGERGERGEKGEKGDTGKDGADGFIDEATISYLEERIDAVSKKDTNFGRVVRGLTAGDNVTIDESVPGYPVISATAGGPGGSTAWGDITGTLSAQTDLQTALDGKADDLGVDDNYVTDAEKTKLSNLSGTNTGDQDLSGYSLTSHNHTGVYEPAKGVDDNFVTDAQLVVLGNTSGTNTGDNATNTQYSGLAASKLDANTPITGATKTKVTYDADGLVTSGADATTADIADSLNKRYVTDANLTTIGNQSGTNTGDETTATIKTKLSITTLSGSNTGDQTSIVGITGTVAQFNTAITDGDLATGGGTATGTNTGDNATNSQYSGLVTNATHTGDATGATALTVVKVQGKAVPAPVAGDDQKYLKYDHGTTAFVYAAPAGTGDVVGPASSVDSEIALFSGVGGKTIKRASNTGMLKAASGVLSTATDGTDFFSSAQAIPAANVPNGISTLRSALFTQSMTAGTYYYVPDSALTMPASSKTGGGMSTSTTMQWQFMMRKTAAGTAAFNVRIYRGVNGTTADTADVTQSIGTATAVVDIATVFVTLKVTATGGTGSYTWGISVQHRAATAAGFGTTDATPFFEGTVSSVAMNTASLKFGIGLMGTTGTTALVLSGLTGQVNNMN